MNTSLRLSVDKALVEKARAAASRQGTSLQGLLRGYIALLAGERSGDDLVSDLQDAWKRPDQHTKAHPLPAARGNSREEIYQGRLSRYGRGR